MADKRKRSIAAVGALTFILVTMVICFVSTGSQNRRLLSDDEDYGDVVLGHGEENFFGFNNRRLLSEHVVGFDQEEEVDVLGHGSEELPEFNKRRLLSDDEPEVLGHGGEELTESNKRRRLLWDDVQVLGHGDELFPGLD